MAEKKYLPPKNLVNPFIKDLGEYNGMYQESIEDPQAFFHKQALNNLDWIEPFKSVHNEKFVDSADTKTSIEKMPPVTRRKRLPITPPK